MKAARGKGEQSVLGGVTVRPTLAMFGAPAPTLQPAPSFGASFGASQPALGAASTPGLFGATATPAASQPQVSLS